MRDLRISVTDRCNFRCRYCMPKEIFNRDYEFLARDLLLSFEEIERIVTVFAGLGVNKIRITGGEPLLRRNLEELIGAIKGVGGIDDVTLTTNASLLERKAESLVAAGASMYEWYPNAMPAGEQLAEHEVLARLVTSFATTDAHVDEFVAAARAAGDR